MAKNIFIRVLYVSNRVVKKSYPKASFPKHKAKEKVFFKKKNRRVRKQLQRKLFTENK